MYVFLFNDKAVHIIFFILYVCVLPVRVSIYIGQRTSQTSLPLKSPNRCHRFATVAGHIVNQVLQVLMFFSALWENWVGSRINLTFISTQPNEITSPTFNK